MLIWLLIEQIPRRDNGFNVDSVGPLGRAQRICIPEERS